jgi:hypothetical protein
MAHSTSSSSETYTITFGDVAENHVRMEQIGTLAETGFSLQELTIAQGWLTSRGANTIIYHLNSLLPPEITTTDAYILVAKRGLGCFVDPDNFHAEQANLQKDTKAFMYGRVVNKIARHNLCFSEVGHEPRYEQGEGRVVAFNDVPLLSTVREGLSQMLPTAINLQAEGNYYYDITKCGIGFHGDGERRKVIAFRTGATMPLKYHWFHESKPVGQPGILALEHGDMYMMSEKAVGFDWKKRSIPTLRHAAGCEKYLVVK